jgi:hypothetical protein
VTRWRILLLAVLLAALVGCTGTEDADSVPSAPTTTLPAECPLGPERCPDPFLTPGAVDPDAGRLDPDLNVPLACGPEGPGRDPRRQLTAAQERAVLAAYHLPAGTKPAEFDHRVAYWAGGLSSPLNVWPQLNAADKVRKDKFEDRLYRQVCVQHTMGLATAQQQMLEFWAHW